MNSLSNPGPFQSTPASGYQDRQIGSVGRPVEYNDKVSIWFVGRVQHAMGRIFGKSESQPVSIIALSRMKGWYPNKLSSTCSQWVHPILCKVSNYLNFPISWITSFDRTGLSRGIIGMRVGGERRILILQRRVSGRKVLLAYLQILIWSLVCHLISTHSGQDSGLYLCRCQAWTNWYQQFKSRSCTRTQSRSVWWRTVFWSRWRWRTHGTWKTIRWFKCRWGKKCIKIATGPNSYYFHLFSPRP